MRSCLPILCAVVVAGITVLVVPVAYAGCISAASLHGSNSLEEHHG